MTAGMLNGIAITKSRIGPMIRWSRRRRSTVAATYEMGSVIAAATTDRSTLFQIAGLTPCALATSRQLSSVHVLVSKLPVQNFESETSTSATIGSNVATT